MKISLIACSLLVPFAFSAQAQYAPRPAAPAASGKATDPASLKADKLYEAAVAAGKAKDWLKSMSLSSEAVKIAPRHAAALHQRACAELELGEIGAAIKDWDQVIILSPKSALAYGSRGNAKRMTGDLAGATADIDQCVRLSPASSFALTFKAQLERSLGHGEEADRLMARVKESKIQEQAGTADVAALLAAGRAAGEKDRKENQPRHARKAFNQVSPAMATLSSGMDPEEVFSVGYAQGYDRTAVAGQPVKTP